MQRLSILTIIAIALSSGAFAEDVKWAPPNVIGMPNYHQETDTHPSPRSEIMNWDLIAGNWKQFTGKIKQRWGQLTDDELAQIHGRREQLEGMLQSKYGYSPEQARREIDSWMTKPNSN